MSAVEKILRVRRKHSWYDEELWKHMSKAHGRNLVNFNDEQLQYRLNTIDRNIQYLDTGVTPRDSLHADNGWLSPWWWLRARFWTLLEFEQRALTPQTTDSIPSMPLIKPGLQGVVAGGRRLLVRVSRIEWLLETVYKGSLRFAAASSYRDPALDAARGDDELSKAYRRPSQVIQISTLEGRRIAAVGDVHFATRRVIDSGDELTDLQYWLLSFSSDLDPRLFREFHYTEPSEHGCIIIFDPNKFVRRALPALSKTAPWAVPSLFPTVYFDPYYTDVELTTLRSKEFGFACQREMRFVLNSRHRKISADNSAVCVNIGSLADIAGVYSCSGRKVAGIGPSSFFA